MRLLAAGLVLLLGAGAVWAHWPAGEPVRGIAANRVLVEKAARRLTLLRDGRALKTYRVALGHHPLGAKTREGDGRTPEGTYAIDSRLVASRFHRALHISYPNNADSLAASGAGTSPGGAIFIHGLRNGMGWIGRAHRLVDWTAGCIAVTNPEIEEIWRLVPDGTTIDIRP